MTEKQSNSYPNFPIITTQPNSTIKQIKLTLLTSMDIRLLNSSQLIARARSKAFQESFKTHSLLIPLKALHLLYTNTHTYT